MVSLKQDSPIILSTTSITEFHETLHEYVSGELETIIPIQSHHPLLKSAKQYGADPKKESSFFDTAKMREELVMKIRQKFPGYSTTGRIMQSIKHYLEMQIKTRMQIFNATLSMYSLYEESTQAVHNAENTMKIHMDDRIDYDTSMEKSSVILKFEKICQQQYSQMEAVFRPHFRWEKLVDVIHQVYQMLHEGSVPSLQHIMNYCTSSISLEPVTTNGTWQTNLMELLNECICKASGVHPLMRQPSDGSIEQIIDPQNWTKYEYLNTAELSKAWSDDKMLLAEGNVTQTQSKYERLCRRIFEQWPLFMQVFLIFEKLNSHVMEAFCLEKCNVQSVFDVTLLQQTLGHMYALIKTVNSELNTFQLRLSDSLQEALHVYMILSIGLFYYDQRKTHFARLMQSFQRTIDFMQHYFTFMIVPTADQNNDRVAQLLTTLCHEFHQSFDQEIRNTVQTAIEKSTDECNQFDIKQKLEYEMQIATDSTLMRYLLDPSEFLSERINSSWNIFKVNIERLIHERIKIYEQSFDEFKIIVDAMKSALESRNSLSPTFIDELFVISFEGANEKIDKNKAICMGVLLYQYLVGETTNESMKIGNRYHFRINRQWQEIIQALPKPSNDLKQIIISMKLHFEMCPINSFETFSNEMIKHFATCKAHLTETLRHSTQSIMGDIRSQFFYRLKGCTVVCPSCRRICDAKHESERIFPIGSMNNQHRCSINHRFAAMGGVSNAATDCALLSSCDRLTDSFRINYQNTMRLNWKSFKQIHSDWNFNQSEIPSNNHDVSLATWNKIGVQLCQHYENRMKFIACNSIIKPYHFFLVLNYPNHMPTRRSPTVQELVRLSETASINDIETREKNYSHMRESLWESLERFLDNLRRRTNSDDLLTIIHGSQHGDSVFRTYSLKEIDNTYIRQVVENSEHNLNHSLAFHTMDHILDQTKSDMKLKHMRCVIIFMSNSIAEICPKNQLQSFFAKHSSIIDRFWTIGLHEESKEVLLRIADAANDTLYLFEDPTELDSIYSNIIEDYQTKMLTQQNSEVPSESNTASADSSEIIVASMQREELCETTPNLVEHSFPPATTSEVTQDLESVSISAIPEEIIYDQLYGLPLPSRIEDILPHELSSIARKIDSHDETVANDILIPLPILSKRSIDYLPTINLVLDIEPSNFDLVRFLMCLADDINVPRDSMVVTEAREGTIHLKINVTWNIAADQEKLDNIEQILISNNLPRSNRFMAMQIKSHRSSSNRQTTTCEFRDIVATLDNFRRAPLDNIRLSPEVLDRSLRMSELMAVLNKAEHHYLRTKSHQISNCLMHASKECPYDYTLQNALLVCNRTRVKQYKDKFNQRHDNEKILFHGTDQENFDGIFRENFQLSKMGGTDKGWFGRGFYFTSTPRKAIQYAKKWTDKSIVHIICCLVAVGKSLRVSDKRFKGKEIGAEYDSHYARVTLAGDAIAGNTNEPFYEEFVIKKNDRILPLFIVGMVRANQCAIWRDASVENDFNSTVLFDIRQRSSFNIYELTRSEDALRILRAKYFVKDDFIKCTIITNGANHGKRFVRECRRICPDIAIVVYCKRKDYHQEWASRVEGPVILVTGNAEEVYQFIQHR